MIFRIPIRLLFDPKFLSQLEKKKDEQYKELFALRGKS